MSKPVNVQGPDGLHFIWVGKTDLDGDFMHLCDDDMARIFCVPKEWVSDATDEQIAEVKKMGEEVEVE